MFGEKNIDFLILIDSYFSETILILKSQGLISLACLLLKNGT